MSRIYWDTMLFIYWLEEHPQHAPKVKELFEKIEQRGDALFTSALTLGEVLAGPHKREAKDVANKFRSFFRDAEVEVLPFTAEAAEHYALIRASQRLAPADAIHLACAAQAGMDLFLTNDHRLRGLVVPGIHFIAGMDVELL